MRQTLARTTISVRISGFNSVTARDPSDYTIFPRRCAGQSKFRRLAPSQSLGCRVGFSVEGLLGSHNIAVGVLRNARAVTKRACSMDAVSRKRCVFPAPGSPSRTTFASSEKTENGRGAASSRRLAVMLICRTARVIEFARLHELVRLQSAQPPPGNRPDLLTRRRPAAAGRSSRPRHLRDWARDERWPEHAFRSAYLSA